MLCPLFFFFFVTFSFGSLLFPFHFLFFFFDVLSTLFSLFLFVTQIAFVFVFSNFFSFFFHRVTQLQKQINALGNLPQNATEVARLREKLDAIIGKNKKEAKKKKHKKGKTEKKKKQNFLKLKQKK